MKNLKGLLLTGCLAAALVLTPNAQGASITASLNCSLNILNSAGSCNNIGPFGTVKLDDSANDGTLKLTVDLLDNTGIKFRDLMLNFAFDTALASSLTSSDGQALTLDNNGFDINPYDGLFDLGVDSGQGWSYDGPNTYMTILSGDASLSLSDFMLMDSLGNLMVALHIQDIGSASGGLCDGGNEPAPCVPGMSGGGSLKIGGTFTEDGDIGEVPEPSTMLLMGGSLLGLAYFRKRRNG